MSRASDAYSRRPDDHRSSGYGRGSGDPYGDDRRHGPERSSKPPSRSNSGIKPPSPRRESSMRKSSGTVPNVRSPPTAPNADPARIQETIAEKLLEVTDACIQLGRMLQHKDNLDRTIKQRQLEHDKTVHKHSEYPSIHELQSKFRGRHSQELARLESSIQSQKSKQKSASEALSSTLASSMALLVQQTQPAVAGPSTTRDNELKRDLERHVLKSKDESQNFKDEIAELKRKNTDMAEKQKDQLAELRDQLKAELKAELEAEIKAEIKAEVKSEVRAEIKLQTEKDRSGDSKLPSVAKLETRMTKQENEVKRLAEQQKKAAENNTDMTTKAAISAAQKHTVELQEKMLKVEEMLATQTKANQLLQGQVDGLAPIVDDHQQRLVGVDFDTLDQVAETFSFEFPQLREAVERSRLELEEVRHMSNQHTESLATWDQKMQGFLNQAVVKLGQMVDADKARITALENRAKATGSSETGSASDKERIYGIEKRLSAVEVVVLQNMSESAAVSRGDAKDRDRLDENQRASNEEFDKRISALESNVKEVADKVSTLSQPDQSLVQAQAAGGKSAGSSPKPATPSPTEQRLSDMEDKLKQLEQELKETASKLSQESQSVLQMLQDGLKEARGGLQDLSAQVKADQDVMGKKVQDLSRAVAEPALKGAIEELRVSLTEVGQDTNRLREELDKKIDYLNLALGNLDDRFSNLSTKELADHILGVVEKLLLPTSRQSLGPDVALLHQRHEDQKKKLEKIEDDLSQIKREVSSVREDVDKSVQKKLRAAEEIEKEFFSPPGAKRRRTDGSPQRHILSNGLE